MSQAAPALDHAVTTDTRLGQNEPATPAAALAIPTEMRQTPRATRPIARPFSALTTSRKPTALNPPVSEVERGRHRRHSGLGGVGGAFRIRACIVVKAPSSWRIGATLGDAIDKL